MPGTGKTATTLEVVNTLKKQKKKFDFHHINAMSLTNPNLVYTLIYEFVTGRRVPPASAALFLDEFFKKKDKLRILQRELARKKKADVQDLTRRCDRMRVILIDELDALVSKK